MKLIQSLILFIFVSTIPTVLTYLLFEGAMRYLLISLFVLLFSIVFKYADKFLLLFLGAREIIEADKKLLFQSFKSNCYRSYVKMPKIYLYSGGRYNSFVLDSGAEWSVVIDRSLIENSNENELVALIDYLVKLKISKSKWLKTKGMGLSAVILKLNYWVIQNVLFIKESSSLYRISCFISLMFLKPLLEFIYWFVGNQNLVECSDELKPIFFVSQNSRKNENFSEFLSLHLIDKTNSKNLILEYLESFDIFKRCKFSEQ